MRGLIIDIGGVLASVPGVVDRWSHRLALPRHELIRAIYGGNDDAVLIGRVAENDWWEIIGGRLGLVVEVLAELRSEMEQGQVWDESLIQVVREANAASRTSILSNAWPSQRSRMIQRGLDDLVHELL